MASLTGTKTKTETESRKYLFVDDMPKYLDIQIQALREAGHRVEIASDLGVAWMWIEGERKADNPFDLVLADLLLARKTGEFGREDQQLRDGLRSKGYGDIPESGQALGLWRRRHEMRQPYCYVANFSWLWVENVDKQDPEFGGKTVEEPDDILMLNKSRLWPDNIEGKLLRARQAWEDEQWLS
uniref:Response regulatory domain-containing protein n=1 Tax=Candidatus Kentrum sp. FM TaxID=2126340 RepID=A0A450VMV5_9GAMM|nr:MAG: hypothetical protein BECKFM1743A_GA0114220_100126 [Candidatus Kentron sp. FM]VFJ44253.1 MAG: hypothetical protein BECKFM1743C_GA0114222_100099 [Candidatus Kentron sp. FM]VFK06156.1 MAG: hypothetical protein BECKFM1743B_GA0114221_1001111 [Candidatus Kentron sp. FM]